MSLVVLLPAGTPAGTDVCARFGDVEQAGTVAHPALTEISGLVGSLAHPGVLWTHNDSGGSPEVFAMDETGADLGAYAVEGADASDWEAIAIGPGPDASGSYLYVGDIGDNDAQRDSVVVYRVPEPAAPPARGGTLTGAEAITLWYPDGPADAEALVVDPRSGDLFIVTKSYLGTSHVLRAPAGALADGAMVAMADEGTLTITSPAGAPIGLPGTAVTGGDVSPDGSIVLLRTYRSVLAFARADDQSVAEALQGPSCFAPQAEEAQGEAVAFTGDGTAYVTASEGSGLQPGGADRVRRARRPGAAEHDDHDHRARDDHGAADDAPPDDGDHRRPHHHDPPPSGAGRRRAGLGAVRHCGSRRAAPPLRPRRGHRLPPVRPGRRPGTDGPRRCRPVVHDAVA